LNGKKRGPRITKRRRPNRWEKGERLLSTTIRGGGGGGEERRLSKQDGDCDVCLKTKRTRSIGGFRGEGLQ